MDDRVFYFLLGAFLTVLLTSLVIYFFAPEALVLKPRFRTGMVVYQALREDLSNAERFGISLEGYDVPFDGKHNLPKLVVYEGREYQPTLASLDEVKRYAGVMDIRYLFSIGEDEQGQKFPMYYVSIGDGFLDGVIVLNTSFPAGSEPFRS